MKKTMIASQPISYGGRRLARGDAFEAKRQDARLLRAVGRATEPPEKNTTPRNARATDKQAAAPDVHQAHADSDAETREQMSRKDMADEAPKRPTKKNRAYKRRDMQAED
jgi:hypothetical protein